MWKWNVFVPVYEYYILDLCLSIYVQTLDKEQCLQWVLGHRLPLFVKSDIYSEFKLCKALTQGDDGVMRDVRWLSGRGEGEMVRGRVRSQSVMGNTFYSLTFPWIEHIWMFCNIASSCLYIQIPYILLE